MSQSTEPVPAPVLPASPTAPVGKAMDHVIPTRNQPALSGYYCAIFSFIPVAGLILGPAAIGYGLIGLDRGNRLPRNIGYGHAIFATVGGIIGTVLNFGMVAATLVLLAFHYMFGLPPFSFEQPPEDNVRQVAPAKDQNKNLN